jgi:DNA/RNA-binding domain of Phe-tRNA-synthetase-like protein
MILKFEEIIAQGAPDLRVVLVEANVTNNPTDDDLWKVVEDAAASVRDTMKMEEVNKRPAIAATRAAYKRFGKEPNRYRPSAEALCRRAVKGLDLYRTLSVIDLINVLSIETGHSIGGFDADSISGDALTLGVGQAGEPYEAIGRGPLNIEGMPVWRDDVGGVGTPTSDNDRTKLSTDTRHLVMTVNVYDPGADLAVVTNRAIELLERYAAATDIRVTEYAVKA